MTIPLHFIRLHILLLHHHRNYLACTARHRIPFKTRLREQIFYLRSLRSKIVKIVGVTPPNPMSVVGKLILLLNDFKQTANKKSIRAILFEMEFLGKTDNSL